MGKFFDRIAGVFLLYILFMGATGRIITSLVLTYITTLLLRRIKRRPRRDISNLAFFPPHEAEALIRGMLGEKYADVPLTCVLRHPSAGKLPPAEVVAKWQEHRGEARLIIVSVQLASPAALDIASRLMEPEICLLDGARLSKYPCDIPDPGCFKLHARKSCLRRMANAAKRSNCGKTLLTGGVMCLLFMLSGTGAYLIGGLMLIFIGLSALKWQRGSQELFSN